MLSYPQKNTLHKKLQDKIYEHFGNNHIFPPCLLLFLIA